MSKSYSEKTNINLTDINGILFVALSVNKGGGSKTSILYEETTQDLQMKRSGPFAVKKNLPTPYSSKKGNIGNIPQFGSMKKRDEVEQTYLGWI